jgi:hypothetical protein
MTAVPISPEVPAGTSPTPGFWSRFLATLLGTVAGIIAAAGTSAVVVAGFTLSYDSIRRVGISAYIRHDWAWLLPVAIDGSMAVATVTAIVMRRLGRSARYPWLVVIVDAGISIMCNAAHAYMHGGLVKLPQGAAMAVSAIPALNLALSVHLLVLLALAIAGHDEEELPPAGKAQVPAGSAAVVPTQVPLNVPATVPADLPPALPAAPRPEVVAEDPAELRPEPRRRAPSPRNRKKTVRRSLAETRQMAEQLQAQFPRETKAEIAKRMGITDRALRKAMNEPNPADRELAGAPIAVGGTR